jgi:predicted lipoprotein with Yx(FWY)xxD motif
MNWLKKSSGAAVVLLGVAVLFLIPGEGVAQAAHMPAGVTVRTLENGTKVFADAKGMTLYTFARDSAGQSNCNGRCAENWPPLMAAENAMAMGDWTIVTREDGSKMWAYKSMPLYTFRRDAKPGDATGEGMANGAWKVAVPPPST